MFNDFLLIFHVMRSPRCLLTEFFLFILLIYEFSHAPSGKSDAEIKFITPEIWLISIFLRYLQRKL